MSHNTFTIISNLPPTNSFIYKEKQYPFNIIVFNQFSSYFESNQPNSIIKLIEDKEDDSTLSDSSIKDFINHCQCQNIILTNQNALPLYKLAKKYIVPTLINEIEKFIIDNKTDFLIQFLTIIQTQQGFDTKPYEEMLSNNFIDYIHDSHLLNLPFNILYRVVTKYQMKHIEEEPSADIIEFLFKCLDKFEHEASSLFEYIDFGKLKNQVIHRLLTEYSQKFDFHFVNSNLLKTLYNVQNEILQREETIRLQQISMNETIQNFNNIITSQNELISNLKKQIDDIKKKPVTIHYLNRDDHNGIIAFLGDSVVLSAGGYLDKREPLSNLKVYNNKAFYNYYNSETNGSDYQICKSENDSYIEFDFQNKKVDLFSYYIRSCNERQNWYHAKSWRIMGSNGSLEKV